MNQSQVDPRQVDLRQIDLREERGAQTREKCIAAAFKIFAQRGYHRATMDEIAAAAGVSKGPLYWHFPNKEAFLIALLEKCTAFWSKEKVDRLPLSAAADKLLG